MSYNIDIWKLKKLNDLAIPLKSFFKCGDTDWHPKKKYDGNGVPTLEFMNGTITGNVENGIVHVGDIKVYGEGSGNEMELIIEPALKDSTGELIASCVWEGGDCIDQIVVKDGRIEWHDIEI